MYREKLQLHATEVRVCVCVAFATELQFIFDASVCVCVLLYTPHTSPDIIFTFDKVKTHTHISTKYVHIRVKYCGKSLMYTLLFVNMVCN